MIIAGMAGGCSAVQPTKYVVPIVEKTIEPIAHSRILTEARVIPIQNAAISFPEPGIVNDVLVKEGEMVEEGEVIARLNGYERAQAAVTQAELLVLVTSKDLDEFVQKSTIATADAEQKLAKAQIEFKNATEARKSLDFQQVSNTALDGLRATYIIALNEFNEAEDDYEPYKDRGEKDVERAELLTRLSNARLAKDRALYNLNKALEMPEEEKIAKVDARLSLAIAILADAQSEYDKVKVGPEVEQLTILETAVRNAEAQLAAAKAGQADLELRAPFKGSVISNELKSGQAVNVDVVVMVADTSAWQIQTTDLVELDVISIQPGDNAKITFDAIPDLEMGGVVRRIKQLGESSKGDITYTITIDLEGTDPRLLWNMKAFVSFDGVNP